MSNARKPVTLDLAPPFHPESDVERTMRQMRLCAEMADFAAQLAREAAANALANPPASEAPSTAAAPSEPPAEPPLSTMSEPPFSTMSEPPSEHPAAPPISLALPPVDLKAEPPAAPALDFPSEIAFAHIAARLRTFRQYLRTPSCKAIDPAVLFTHLARIVHDCITMEVRLAAGLAIASNAASRTGRPESRRDTLYESFRYITEGDAELLHEATTRLEQILAADPAQTIDLPEIFATICEELGIEIDLTALPDEYRDLLTDPDDEDEDLLDPHATYPP